MIKGVIYYSDFHADPKIIEVCQKHLRQSFDGEIISATLGPSDFGDKNLVLEGMRSWPTAVRQIVAALKESSADVVFFTEHDVLYNKTHFELTPESDKIFYYNINNWRWDYPDDRIVQYDGLTSLSQMFGYKSLILDHFQKRLDRIEKEGWEIIEGRQPHWQRALGYEPGTKRRRIGGFSDDTHEKKRSTVPNIDIRHKDTLTSRKTKLEDFKHQPTNFVETTLNNIPGWDLKGILSEITKR